MTWARLFIATLFILNISCAEDITVTENDHKIFPLNKKENRNKVIYAVKTDGKCAITGIFCYWQMDAEDGHTEKLLSYEEDVYGVKNIQKLDGENWTFNVAKMPEREIRATVISEKSVDSQSVVCRFAAITKISGVESTLAEVMVNNDGHSVDSIDFYGTRLTDETAIQENFVP